MSRNKHIVERRPLDDEERRRRRMDRIPVLENKAHEGLTLHPPPNTGSEGNT